MTSFARFLKKITLSSYTLWLCRVHKSIQLAIPKHLEHSDMDSSLKSLFEKRNVDHYAEGSIQYVIHMNYSENRWYHTQVFVAIVCCLLFSCISMCVYTYVFIERVFFLFILLCVITPTSVLGKQKWWFILKRFLMKSKVNICVVAMIK